MGNKDVADYMERWKDMIFINRLTASSQDDILQEWESEAFEALHPTDRDVYMEIRQTLNWKTRYEFLSRA